MKVVVSNSRASYYVGGTEVVSLHQARGLAERGHEITYLTRAVPDAEKSEYFTEFTEKIYEAHLPIKIGEVAVEAMYGDGSSWQKWNDEARAFGEAAQDTYSEALRDADLSVAHMSADSIYMPSVKPHILHLHGSPKSQDDVMSGWEDKPSRAIAHADSILEWWQQNYPNIPMDIFRNGVPVEMFYHPVDADRPIDILYVGRLLKHKGIYDILAAANPAQRIVIAGGGVERDNIDSFIRTNGLDAMIVDSPDNETLVGLYKKSKVFACPSRAKEGVLTTMLEAGAAGCAIVTASGSGMTDLAVDGNNSRVVSPGDVRGLSHAFTGLLASPNDRCQLAQRMQETILRAWSWEKKAEELEALYEKVV